MAGRGTDIRLGEGVAALGGLSVIGTNLHESRRIDNQLRGRAGRQADPGSSRFFVSLEDALLVKYGDLDPASAKHLVRITVGKLRLGIGDPTVLDALSFAKRGDRSLRPVLEGAYNRTSDLGLIARTLWERGETGLDALKVRAGHPLRPQLAERLPNPEAVIK